MGQVLTNNTGWQYAREDSLGVLPGSPDWKVLEPNDYGEVGPLVETVARNPISKLRQRRKGTIVGQDASASYDADVTLDSLLDFAESFVFATATNNDLTFRAADHTGTAYTIPAATAAQAGKIQFTSGGPITLVYARGYANSGNNGLFPLTADTATSGTALTTGTGTAETAPTNAEVSVAGIRAEAGDLALAVSSTTGTLTSGNGTSSNPIDFTTLGLTVGQRIHVGGMTSTNRFGSTAAGDGTRSYGSARIRTIAAGTLTLDKMDSTLVASDGTDDGTAGTEVQVDLLFGRFVRNVQTDDSAYALISHQFEASFPNLYETIPPTSVANPDGFQYITGAVPNTLTWNMPLRGKADATFDFIAIDAEDMVDNASRKTNASAARLPLFTEAFNTSSNFFRLGLFDVDETGLLSYFKNLTITITNNVSRENILGQLAAFAINVGNFNLDIEAEALFTSPAVSARIKANTTVTMDWLLRNDDGAVHVDVPSATLGGGQPNYPVNETVRIQTTVAAFVDEFFQTSIGMSFFPVYPSS